MPRSPVSTPRRPRSEPGPARFSAFMSYSHAADGRFAPALQLALHRFTKPWYRLRAVRVFRDDASLATSAGLWSAIEQALLTSEYFILLASPESAASTWVAREVSCWTRERGARRILIVLTDGDLCWDATADDFDWSRTTALPRVLQGVFPEEPRHVDLRAVADNPERLTLRDEQFRSGVADLAATLHGRPKDELLGEDVRQHHRVRRITQAVIAVLSVLLLLAAVLGVVAVDQRDEARSQARTATSRLLATRALLEDRLDRSLLLALGAWELEQGPYARGALADSLRRSTHVLHVLQGRGRVDAVTFSPDGGLLAASGRDGSVQLYGWSADGPRLLVELAGHDAPVRTLAFSPDGRTLASGDNAGRIVLWDVAARAQSGAALAGSGAPIRSLVFTPDGRRLVAGGDDRVARVWDVEQRRVVLPPLDAHDGQVTTVAVSPDGRLVATGGADLTVRLWDLGTGSPVGSPLQGHANWVSDLVFVGPDGGLLLSSSDDGTIRWWDVAGGSPASGPVADDLGRIRGIAVSSDGSTVASVGEDRTVRLWGMPDTTVSDRALGSVGGPVRSVAFRPQGDVLATGADDGTVVIWNAGPASSVIDSPLLGPADSAVGAAFLQDGAQVATAHADGAVRVWDVRTRRPLGDPLLPPGPPGVTLLAADPAGAVLAVARPDGISVWDTATRSQIRFLRPRARPTALAVDAAARTLAVAVAAPEPASVVELWDITTGVRRPEDLVATRRGVNEVAFDPEGGRLAAATHDSALVVWDLDSPGTPQIPSLQQAGQVTVVAFSGAQEVVTGADDGSLVLTDLVSGAAVGARMAGHAGRVRALAVDRRQGLILSGGEDGRVILWDRGSQSRVGGALLTFSGPVGDLQLLSGGGSTVAAAAPTGVVLATTDVEVWRQTACRIAGRDLTDEEWRLTVGFDVDVVRVCSPPDAAGSGGA